MFEEIFRAVKDCAEMAGPRRALRVLLDHSGEDPRDLIAALYDAEAEEIAEVVTWERAQGWGARS